MVSTVQGVAGYLVIKLGPPPLWDFLLRLSLSKMLVFTPTQVYLGQLVEDIAAIVLVIMPWARTRCSRSLYTTLPHRRQNNTALLQGDGYGV